MWPEYARIVADRIEVSYEPSTHRIEYADGTASEIPLRGRNKERRRFQAILGDTAASEEFMDWALGVRGEDFDYPDCWYGRWPARFVEGSRGIRLRRRGSAGIGEEWTAACELEMQSPVLPPSFESTTPPFQLHDGFAQPFADTRTTGIFDAPYAYWGYGVPGDGVYEARRLVRWVGLELPNRILTDAGAGPEETVTQPPPALGLVGAVNFEFGGESFSLTDADVIDPGVFSLNFRFDGSDYPITDGDNLALTYNVKPADVSRFQAARARALADGLAITIRLDPFGRAPRNVLDARISPEVEAAFTPNARRYQGDAGVSLQQSTRRTVLESRELRGWLTEDEAAISAALFGSAVDKGGLVDVPTSGGVRRALLPGGRAALRMRSRALDGRRTWDTVIRCEFLPRGWAG